MGVEVGVDPLADTGKVDGDVCDTPRVEVPAQRVPHPTATARSVSPGQPSRPRRRALTTLLRSGPQASQRGWSTPGCQAPKVVGPVAAPAVAATASCGRVVIQILATICPWTPTCRWSWPGSWRWSSTLRCRLFSRFGTRITTAVEDGVLRPEVRLPPVRLLATHLGLAVNTVARSYRELELAGVVETRGRHRDLRACRPVPDAQARIQRSASISPGACGRWASGPRRCSPSCATNWSVRAAVRALRRNPDPRRRLARPVEP